jgi:hypothetical protein
MELLATPTVGVELQDALALTAPPLEIAMQLPPSAATQIPSSPLAGIDSHFCTQLLALQ